MSKSWWLHTYTLPEQRQMLHDQLPRALRERLSLSLESTELPLGGFQYRAIFRDETGRNFECIVGEHPEHPNTWVPAHCKLRIPEEFIAHLCVVV